MVYIIYLKNIKHIKNKPPNTLTEKYKTDNKTSKFIKKTKNISEVFIKNNLILILIVFVSIINYDKTFKLIKLP